MKMWKKHEYARENSQEPWICPWKREKTENTSAKKHKNVKKRKYAGKKKHENEKKKLRISQRKTMKMQKTNKKTNKKPWIRWWKTTKMETPTPVNTLVEKHKCKKKKTPGIRQN